MTKAKKEAGKSRRKAPRCHTCGRVIRVPEGWSAGSAARRHYWRKHPEIMRGGKS